MLMGYGHKLFGPKLPSYHYRGATNYPRRSHQWYLWLIPALIHHLHSKHPRNSPSHLDTYQLSKPSNPFFFSLANWLFTLTEFKDRATCRQKGFLKFTHLALKVAFDPYSEKLSTPDKMSFTFALTVI